MVQLRKSRKSFRKTRGRKTRQRKNEKRKSSKTRSTRKTGGLGESIIANKIKELASKIGELIKLSRIDIEHASEKMGEIQEIFDWLSRRKWGRCGDGDATCDRKKMIYYYIAIHLFVYFTKIILKNNDDTGHTERGGQKEDLNAKFEKHKTKYNASTSGKGTPVGEDDPLNMWKNQGEPKFISGIVKTLYDSILEEEERTVDGFGISEGGDKYYGHVITKIILEEVEMENDIDVDEKKSIFVKWIEQIKNLKEIKKKGAKNYLGAVSRNIVTDVNNVTKQIQNRLETWAHANGIEEFV